MISTTGKERDSETGLDYFEARYVRSSLGRFTTVDPAMTIARNVVIPQKWNRYAYVRNNPMRYVDPDGRDEEEQAKQLAQASQVQPSTKEVEAELGRLADSYNVPQVLVRSIAETENAGLDVNALNKNLDKNGNVASIDYGLMQVNDININGTVTGSNGKSITVTESVKSDWKYNAEIGVAIIAQAYRTATKEQLKGTAETIAQQVYSSYNAGPRRRGRYLEKDETGKDFADHRDRAFLAIYRRRSDGGD